MHQETRSGSLHKSNPSQDTAGTSSGTRPSSDSLDNLDADGTRRFLRWAAFLAKHGFTTCGGGPTGSGGFWALVSQRGWWNTRAPKDKVEYLSLFFWARWNAFPDL